MRSLPLTAEDEGRQRRGHAVSESLKLCDSSRLILVCVAVV